MSEKFQMIKATAQDKAFPIPLDIGEDPPLLIQLKQTRIWKDWTEGFQVIRSVIPDSESKVIYVLLLQPKPARCQLIRFYQMHSESWYVSTDGWMDTHQILSHLMGAMVKFYQMGHHDGWMKPRKSKQ